MIAQQVSRIVRHPDAEREVALALDRAWPGPCDLCGAPGFQVTGDNVYCEHSSVACAGGCLDGGCAALLGYACDACFGRAALRSLRWVYAGGMRREEDALYALEI